MDHHSSEGSAPLLIEVLRAQLGAVVPVLSVFGVVSSHSAASLYSDRHPDWMNHLSNGRAAWVSVRAVASSVAVYGAFVGSFVRSVCGQSMILWSNFSASAPN